MKKSLLFLMAALLLGMVSSCKKETVDVTDLLKSVPSSAAGVMVFNIEGMLEDTGCKVKDHEVKPSDEIKALLKESGSEKYEDVMMLFNGETGIEPKGAVIFYDTNRSYLTVALYDVDKFYQYVEKKNGKKFEDAGSGVKVAGNIAVKGAQAWLCLSYGKRIDPETISSYASLASSQSFLVTPMGEELLISEKDIRGWGLVKTLLNETLSVYHRNAVTMGLGFLFEDVEALKFSVNFEKGEMEAEAHFLNDKNRPAKYQLPAEKVNVNTLKAIGGTCDAMMAFTVSPKLIKKFDQLGNALGGALFGDLGEMFKNIDGTIGVAASGTGVDESFSGVITTKGEVSKDLRDMISDNFGSLSMDGKLLRFTRGDVKGALNVEECAEALKGCCLGLVMDGSGYNGIGYGQAPTGFKDIVVKLEPESGGLELEVTLHTIDPKTNALLTLLQNQKSFR